MKYNLGVLKGQNTVFTFEKDGRLCFISGVITKTKQNKTHVSFYFESGKVLTINDRIFRHMQIRMSYTDKSVLFSGSDESFISGIVGFTMFDVMGFPLELTQEILEEEGYTLDVVGFEVLRLLQKEMNSNTFKNKDAFGGKE